MANSFVLNWRDLERLLKDSAADIQVVAAEALVHLGKVDLGTERLQDVVRTGNEYEGLAALNALEMLARDKVLSVGTVKALLKDFNLKGLHARVLEGIEAI